MRVMSPVKYIGHRIEKNGLKELLKKTDSGYPGIFALGYYSKMDNLICVCKVWKWKLCYIHEIGHWLGLKHPAHPRNPRTWWDVMHPWRILRGRRGTGIIFDMLDDYEVGYFEVLAGAVVFDCCTLK